MPNLVKERDLTIWYFNCELDYRNGLV